MYRIGDKVIYYWGLVGIITDICIDENNGELLGYYIDNNTNLITPKEIKSGYTD